MERVHPFCYAGSATEGAGSSLVIAAVDGDRDGYRDGFRQEIRLKSGIEPSLWLQHLLDGKGNFVFQRKGGLVNGELPV